MTDMIKIKMILAYLHVSFLSSYHHCYRYQYYYYSVRSIICSYAHLLICSLLIFRVFYKYYPCRGAVPIPLIVDR